MMPVALKPTPTDPTLKAGIDVYRKQAKTEAIGIVWKRFRASACGAAWFKELERAYGHRCLYCDHSPARSIDHRYAKSASVERAFAWKNFRPSCGDCNRLKGTRAIVDPVSADPRVFIEYDVSTGKPACRHAPALPYPVAPRYGRGGRRKRSAVSIRKVKIEGFRSLREVTWEPGKLNVVIGPNGSGKSNLLRALALLQKAGTGDLPQEIIRLGGIAPLLWDGQAKEIAWTVDTDAVNTPHVPAGTRLIYELRLRQLGASSVYRVEREQLSECLLQADQADLPHHIFFDRRPGKPIKFDLKEGGFTPHEGAISDEQPLASGLYFADWFVASLLDTLVGWSIYHDIHVDQQAPLRQAAVARMERRVAADGQNLIPVLHTLYTGSRDFKKLVDDAMRAAFSKDYEELVFPPAADQRVQLRVRWRSLKTEQSAADLSDGTIRFLLLLAILGNPTPGALIALDEPENGLHPSMLPIVAELAVEASERSQIILTTHSPQLLDAFTGTPPTTTVAQCVDGETRLAVVDREELQRWLGEYTLGALFRSGELEGMV